MLLVKKFKKLTNNFISFIIFILFIKKMAFTGYTIYNDFIITIKVLDDEPKPYISVIIKEENKLYATYYTTDYEIIEVEDVDGNILNEKVELQGGVYYRLTKEVPINKINQKIFFYDGNILCKEFTGIQKMWYINGQIFSIFFHINGKKYGEYKQYYSNGQLSLECVYVNNKIEGEYKEYDEEGNLERIDYYVAGEKV
jgi:antitoxin component YwqK of YwqJK toxin-antitoxin module